MEGRQNVEERTHEFAFAANAGGNGATIQRDAPGQWLYVAFGCDLDARRGGAIVRDMNGDVLLKSMQYAGSGALSDNFLRAIADEQHAAVTERNWREMAASLATPAAEPLTLGGAPLHLRALRISREYRPDIVEPQPDTAVTGMRVWPAQALAPARAVAEAVERTLGYPGQRSTRTVTVDESFVSLAPGSAAFPARGKLRRRLLTITATVGATRATRREEIAQGDGTGSSAQWSVASVAISGRRPPRTGHQRPTTPPRKPFRGGSSPSSERVRPQRRWPTPRPAPSAQCSVPRRRE